MCLNARSKVSAQIDIPAEIGKTPVGLISGAGAVWVVLLGGRDQGSGAFGRIDTGENVTWFKLKAPEIERAGLLHLAFDPPEARRGPGIWLLGSSIISKNVIDLMVRVDFNDSYTEVVHEEVAALPTQLCKAHRILPLQKSIFATELATSTAAQLMKEPGPAENNSTYEDPA
ncbi:MAG TPA: hypothetical protein VKR06_07580 [Ktedonosporobacter sp.]|nr:hypothetical protein [Ktedonosporobacter sp.]